MSTDLVASPAESVSDAPAQASQAPEAPQSQAPVSGGEGAAAASTEYTPKLKYNFLDKEKDFPDWAKPVVKSAEIEKEIRDVLERAEGLPHIKQRRDALENENRYYKDNWGPVVADVQKVIGYKNKKDYDSFFEALAIPENELFKYVYNRIQLRENPQQFAAHEQMRQLQLRNQELEQQYQSTQATAQDMAVERRGWELEQELSKPDVSATVQAFEARMNQPGAFRAEVIRRGQAYAAQGRDIPANQAVQEVLQLIGWQGQATSPPIVQNQAQSKATLPNIRGKGTSPTQAIPKSTAELRQLAKQLRG